MEHIGFESKYLYMFKHNLFVYYKEKGDLSKFTCNELGFGKGGIKKFRRFQSAIF